MSGRSPSPILPSEPNDNKQWTCIECNGKFPLSKLLETHAVETDHKAYRCTKEKSCGKVFTLRPSWIRHERLHSAKKAHACSRCGKKFHRKDNCHDHERTCGRVARRARVSSQSASTSPTTTSSGTTGSGTPIDLRTTIVDDGDMSHATETGHNGLLSFDHSNATLEKDNDHDEARAAPSVSRQLSALPMPPPGPSIAYFSAASIAPTQSRTATLQARTANDPPSAGNVTLPIFGNTDNHTTSPNTTSHAHADNDWRHYWQIYQSPYDARSPNLQYTEEDRDFTPVLQAYPTVSMPASDGRDRYEDITAIWQPHFQFGCNSSRVPPRDWAPPCGDRGANWNYSNSNKDTNKPPSSEPKPEPSPHSSPPSKPESTPPSKITIFLSMLKEFIKAPFRSYKQWQHGWWTTAMISGIGFAYIAFKKLF